MSAEMMPLSELVVVDMASDVYPVVKPKANPRGTSNGNAAGSSAERRRRKEWLVLEFRADVDLWHHQITGEWEAVPRGQGVAACRCYRCGTLLHVGTVFVDRRVPGAKGGTYARHNIRPNCSSCSAITGNELRVELARQKRVKIRKGYGA